MPATRPIICLTERSRVGESSWPRKYFWATMFVAFCDHVAGNSTSSWRNEPTAAVRALPLDGLERMHAGLREQAPHGQGLAGAGSFVSVVCGVCCSMREAPFPAWPSGRSAKFDGPTSFEVASDGLAAVGAADLECAGKCDLTFYRSGIVDPRLFGIGYRPRRSQSPKSPHAPVAR